VVALPLLLQLVLLLRLREQCAAATASRTLMAQQSGE
jgi:hypothetical protein